MALLADLLSRVRLELGDEAKQFVYSSTGDGTTTRFYLNAKPVELDNLTVLVAGVAIPYPAGYTIEQKTGIITLAVAPANAATIKVTGISNRYFLDDDLCIFINTAVIQHSHNRTDGTGSAITIASIPAVEEYPVAILSVIEALWALATDAAFDINIFAPDGVTTRIDTPRSGVATTPTAVTVTDSTPATMLPFEIVSDEATVAAAFTGATETRPKPNADTATSAMRLRSVFVDICFLSISRSEEFPPVGFG